MPRVRVRKTSRGQIELSRYRDAYEEVKAGDSLRNAADKHGINHCSLLRYIRKHDASGEDDQVMGYEAHNRIFNEEQEQELSKYLIRCADIYFGLPKKKKADPEKSGFNASLVNSGLTKSAQKVVLAMFATIATQTDPYAKF
ncbi:hypothetical protein JTB14_001680 [Gonioctena quinquepunctata]|nr:hypothetical protein JTB14_001680 [Gonioctena quinquepunctata]